MADSDSYSETDADGASPPTAAGGRPLRVAVRYGASADAGTVRAAAAAAEALRASGAAADLGTGYPGEADCGRFDAAVLIGPTAFGADGPDRMPAVPLVAVWLAGEVRRLAFCRGKRLNGLRRQGRLPRIAAVPSDAAAALLRRKLGWEGVLPEVLPEVAVTEAFSDLPALCRRAAEQVPPLSALGLSRALEDGRMVFLGHGARRVCLRVPEVPYVVKFYRRPCDLKENVSREVRRELSAARDSERRNTSCEEWAYFHGTILRCPPEVRAVFPDCVEKIYLPGYGWGILESLVVNADGTLPVPLAAWIRGQREDTPRRREVLRMLQRTGRLFYTYAIRVFDLQNLFLRVGSDGTFTVRLTDFEPRSRTLIPIDRLCRQMVRNKFLRRYRRYLRSLGLAFSEADISSDNP